MSIVVSTPSARIPRNSHRLLTPVPVPTSTTALALLAAAMNRSAAPVAGPTGTRPTSLAWARAAASTASSATYASVKSRAWVAFCWGTLLDAAMAHLLAGLPDVTESLGNPGPVWGTPVRVILGLRMDEGVPIVTDWARPGSGPQPAPPTRADSPWWSDALTDPWRDPSAPAAVVVSPANVDAPAPEPVGAAGPEQRRG